MATPPALVVLAAGASRRLGEPKAAAEIAGKPAIAHLLDAGTAVLEEAWVVTGADHALLAGLLSERDDVHLIENPDWNAGRTGSLARAVEALPGRDLVLAPVDVPLVPEAVFRALVAAWAEAGRPPRGWWAPHLEQAGRVRFGHPVLIGRALAAEVPGMAPDEPLWGLRHRAEPLGSVAVTDPAVVDDLDGPQDLKNLRDRAPDRPSGRD